MATEPTDAEIIALADETRTGEPGRDGYILPISFARAVLARWGQPSWAGEPVAWYVTGCGRLLDEDEAKAEARHIGGTARAIPLYTVPHADSQPAPVPDMTVMQLAESVGLIGPASRTHDLHAAIQRFHDLICANATIKAAQMAAEAIDAARAAQEGSSNGLKT